MGKYVAQVQDHLILPALVHLPEEDELVRRRARKHVPAPVAIRLIIDTGSKRTTLIPGIVRHLAPQSARGVHVVTPLGSAATEFFWVRLEFPEAGLAPFEHVPVAQLPMPPDLAQFHGLLGRDLLSRFYSFHLDSRRRRYILRDSPGLLGWLGRWL